MPKTTEELMEINRKRLEKETERKEKSEMYQLEYKMRDRFMRENERKRNQKEYYLKKKEKSNELPKLSNENTPQ
jgi:hypothetical protein